MTKHLPNRFLLSTAVLPILATLQTASAQQFDPAWRLHVDLAFVEPSGNLASVDVRGFGTEVDFDSGAGAGIRGEYQFSRLLGAEVGALGTSSVDVRAGVFSDLIGAAVKVSSFAPVTLGLNVHLTPASRVDLYVGPFLAIVNYGNVGIEAGIGGASTKVSVDRDVGWGAIVGLDVPIGKRGWSVQTNLRYIDTNFKGSTSAISFDSNFDPVVFSVGFGYRF